MPARPEPIAPLAGLPPYHVPHAPAAAIDLWLHGNEGPTPPPELLAAISPETVRRYPAPESLAAQLAARQGLDPAQVLVTAGADDALERAFRAYVAHPGAEVVLATPTFVMLPHYARVVGATVRAVPWPAEDFPLSGVLAAIGPRTRAVALVSPNNPTGAVIPAAAIRDVAAAAPHALILVDLAYGELADLDLTDVARDLPNALVFRTLSKAWGLAGARVGYVHGPADLVAPLRAIAPPYAVAATSLALAGERLRTGEADMRAYVARVRRERLALVDLLRDLGTRPVASQANFVFTRLATPAHAVRLRDDLAARGIAVRAFPGDRDVGDGVRITCPGDERHLARLTAALRAVLTADPPGPEPA